MNKTIRLSVQLSFLCISSYMLCMNQHPQQKYQNEYVSIRQYYEEYIRERQNILKNESPQSFKQVKNQLNQILQQCTKDLIDKTYKLLIDIQNAHNLSTPTKSIEIINILYEYQDNLIIASPSTYHDITLKKNIRDLLSDKLKINDIHPQRITIRKDNTVPLYNIKSSLSNTCLPSSLSTIAIDIVINEKSFLTLSDTHQAAICACIAEEITQGAPVIPHIITELDPSIQTNLKPQFMALHNICKNKLPMFFSCLKNPDTTFSMIQLVPDYYGNFTKEEYTLICIINASWKMLEWIETQRIYNFIISLGTLLPKLSKINGAISDNS